MKVKTALRNVILIAVFAVTVAFLSGCGGVSETEMTQLKSLRSEVGSLQTQANSLKALRSKLTSQISEKEAKLQKCNKQKEETKANLKKLGQ
ncbi:MAG TPA: hypothetical protein ENI76_06230 [Ignavibacteria bacterium]|nr:hypothetical protein [Ignavibacteria bacterium]